MKRCINAILKQSIKVDMIIVIDNDSDLELASDLQNLSSKIEVISQPNVGGAGAFKLGIQLALNANADFVWTMDDDGYPHERCLERLLSNEDRVNPTSALVLDELDQNTFAFGLKILPCNKYEKIPELLRAVKKISCLDNLPKNEIHGIGDFFNGCLLPRKYLEVVGLPAASFFIRGDEFEFVLRSLSKGYRINISSDAFFYHPSPSVKKLRFLSIEVCEDMPVWKRRHFYLNYYLIFSKYKLRKKLLLHLFRIIISELIYLIKFEPTVVSEPLDLIRMFKLKRAELHAIE